MEGVWRNIGSEGGNPGGFQVIKKVRDFVWTKEVNLDHEKLINEI